jgi:hypothetical protein
MQDTLFPSVALIHTPLTAWVRQAIPSKAREVNTMSLHSLILKLRGLCNYNDPSQIDDRCHLAKIAFTVF